MRARAYRKVMKTAANCPHCPPALMSSSLSFTSADLHAMGKTVVGNRVVDLEAAGAVPRLITCAPYGTARNGRAFKSKWEAQYHQHLELLEKTKAIAWFGYECIRLRLADGAYFTADFPVLTTHGQLVMCEVKGFWREAAKLRVKVAAKEFPWLRIEVITKRDGQWVLLETYNASRWSKTSETSEKTANPCI